MALSVNPIQQVSFKSNNTSKKQESKKENPINENGERANLVLGTFAAGLGFGARALVDLFDGDFVVDNLYDAGSKVANKNFKNSSQTKKVVAAIGATIGFVGLFIAGVAAVYTIFKTPSINYETKVNTFKKSKDMDVYIKGNEVEKELYTQLNEKAINASKEEKEKLKEQYFLLKAAKNQVPEFAKF